MHFYSVFFLEDQPLEDKGLVLVSQKISLFALLLPGFWALFNRLWLVFFAYFAVLFGLGMGLEAFGFSPSINFLVSFLLALFVALSASYLKEQQLLAQGYKEQAPVEASSLHEAEKKALEQLVKDTDIPKLYQDRSSKVKTEMEQENDYDN